MIWADDFLRLQAIGCSRTLANEGELAPSLWNYKNDAADSLRAELARERERHQEMRGIVEEYRESHINSRHPCSNEGLGGPDSRCSTCKQADALLEPAPVATPMEEK